MPFLRDCRESDWWKELIFPREGYITEPVSRLPLCVDALERLVLQRR